MSELPGNATALLLTVFALGFRHGMDPDHVAAIDSITRANAARRPWFAPWSGFLFSLGHGVVVILVAMGVGLYAREWNAPEWLDAAGSWISIAFLVVLGTMNLNAVRVTAADQVVAPAGPRSRMLDRTTGRLFGRRESAAHPALVALTGALFAVSFDTISQAALFALAATTLGGWGFSALLGAGFMAGMMAVDGLNGLWVSRLLRRADRTALIVSRALGLTIGCLSLLVAALAVARQLFPEVELAVEGREWLLGLGAAAIVAWSFATGMRLAGMKPVGLA